MIGIILTGVVVTSSEKRGQLTSVHKGHQEWTTVIQGITATGWAIPPHIVFKGRYHLSAWYKEDTIPQDCLISVSENGWTTNEIGFEWLEHFNAQHLFRPLDPLPVRLTGLRPFESAFSYAICAQKLLCLMSRAAALGQPATSVNAVSSQCPF
jgi:hypothetical protein